MHITIAGLAAVAGLIAVPVAAQVPEPPAAPSPVPGKRPEVPKSIANVKATNARNGPLFQRASAAFVAARDGGDAAFAAFLAEGAKLQLSSYIYPQPLRHEPFSAPLIQALLASCDGPLSHDEGDDWAQLSFVCRVDGEAPITRFYVFRESPEIVMHIDFSGDRIRWIDAMEPIPLPGVRRVAMNAWEVAHGQSQGADQGEDRGGE